MADGKFEIDPNSGSDGKFGLSKFGGIFRHCGNCCCDSCSSTVTSCFGTAFNGDREKIRAGRSPDDDADECYCFVDPEDPRSGQGKCNYKCARLDVYSCATHDGVKFVVPTGTTGEPRTEIVLNTDYPKTESLPGPDPEQNAYMGPFCWCNRCGESKCADNATVDNYTIDDPPFWWENCGTAAGYDGIGGWPRFHGCNPLFEPNGCINIWWQFTTAEWTTIFNKYDGTLPTAGDKFALILYLSFRRRWSICEADSTISLEAVHISCEDQ